MEQRNIVENVANIDPINPHQRQQQTNKRQLQGKTSHRAASMQRLSNATAAGANWRHITRQSNDYFSRCDSNPNIAAANTTHTHTHVLNWKIEWNRRCRSDGAFDPAEFSQMQADDCANQSPNTLYQWFYPCQREIFNDIISFYRFWIHLLSTMIHPHYIKMLGFFGPRFQFSNEMSPQLHSKVWPLKSKCSNFIH